MRPPLRPHPNPYASPADPGGEAAARPLRPGACGSLVASGLLYRQVAVTAPVEAIVEFDGRSWRDVVRLDGRIAAWKVSWWRITPRLDFAIPAAGGDLPASAQIRIWPWLAVRAFRVEVAGQAVYEEGDQKALAPGAFRRVLRRACAAWRKLARPRRRN